ncbi:MULTISPECIES: hypothetical protein [Nostocaceae]|nr:MULTISPECIES: hypothetical protein [Nostocaceae]
MVIPVTPAGTESSWYVRRSPTSGSVAWLAPDTGKHYQHLPHTRE